MTPPNTTDLWFYGIDSNDQTCGNPLASLSASKRGEGNLDVIGYHHHGIGIRRPHGAAGDHAWPRSLSQ